jgi:hypothetical protein
VGIAWMALMGGLMQDGGEGGRGTRPQAAAQNRVPKLSRHNNGRASDWGTERCSHSLEFCPVRNRAERRAGSRVKRILTPPCEGRFAYSTIQLHSLAPTYSRAAVPFDIISRLHTLLFDS